MFCCLFLCTMFIDRFLHNRNVNKYWSIVRWSLCTQIATFCRLSQHVDVYLLFSAGNMCWGRWFQHFSLVSHEFPDDLVSFVSIFWINCDCNLCHWRFSSLHKSFCSLCLTFFAHSFVRHDLIYEVLLGQCCVIRFHGSCIFLLKTMLFVLGEISVAIFERSFNDTKQNIWFVLHVGLHICMIHKYSLTQVNISRRNFFVFHGNARIWIFCCSGLRFWTQTIQTLMDIDSSRSTSATATSYSPTSLSAPLIDLWVFIFSFVIYIVLIKLSLIIKNYKLKFFHALYS